MLIAGMAIFSLSLILDLGTVKAQDASPNLVVSTPYVTKVSDVRGSTYQDIGYSNGTHVWTGGLEQWWKTSNGTYIPYIISSNSTHIFFDSKQFPFAISKNTCSVTAYDPGMRIAQNPTVIIGQEYWNYGYKTATQTTYTIVDTSSLTCTFTELTNSSGYFVNTIKSDSNVQLSVTYSKRINQPFETFVTLTNLNSALNGDNFEPVEQLNRVHVSTMTAFTNHVTPNVAISLPDGTITIPYTTLANNNLFFTNVKDNALSLGLTNASSNFSQLTGTKSGDLSTVTIEFGRNQPSLSSGQSLTLDPTWTWRQVGVEKSIQTNSATGTSCPNGSYSLNTDGQYYFGYIPSSDTSYICIQSALRWDTSSIPGGSVVTETDVKYDVSYAYGSAHNCDWVGVAHDISTATPQTIYTDISSGTVYQSNTSGCNTVGTGKTLTLGSAANTDLQNALPNGFFQVGTKLTSETRVSGSSNYVNYYSASNPSQIYLQVVYTSGGGGGGSDTFSGNINIGGNIYSTNSTGPFKITTQPGVGICIGAC